MQTTLWARRIDITIEKKKKLGAGSLWKNAKLIRMFQTYEQIFNHITVIKRKFV